MIFTTSNSEPKAYAEKHFLDAAHLQKFFPCPSKTEKRFKDMSLTKFFQVRIFIFFGFLTVRSQCGLLYG